MFDRAVEKAYKITGWPSKFLITPWGKKIRIPFEADWEKYTSIYVNF